MRKIFYMPILRAKQGEFSAYAKLNQEVKNRIIPIFETKEFLYSTTEETNKSKASEITLKKHIKNYCLKDKIGFDLKNNIELMKELIDLNFNIIPVIELERFEAFEMNFLKSEKVISNFIIRIKFPFLLEGELHKLKEIFEEYSDVYHIYLLFDLGDIIEYEQRKTVVQQFKNLIIFIKENRVNLKVIVSSSSLPKNLNSVEAGKIKRVDKLEFKLFKKIEEKFSDIFFLYSDYGISKNTDVDIDFSKTGLGNKILAKIRYTLNEHYLLLKGRNESENKVNHSKIGYKELVKKLIESKEFMGADFSYGDKKIAALPSTKDRTGSHTTLIEYGTNHHIAVILKQLSQYYEI